MPAFLARRRASPGGAAGRGGLSARRRSEGRRGVVVALVSTAVVFTGLGFAIVNAPGWPEIQRQFFDRHEFTNTFPEIASAFLLNVKIFCISEVFILVLALLLAVIRSLPGPVFFPLRTLEDEDLGDAEDLHVQEE